ncbi:MAG TPA: hypothetical protein VLN61_01245 [Pseudolabrys sp.]|nr:hypothetical protein [Pseudolabrys sp.]
MADHAAQRVDAVHAGLPENAARVARLSAVLAVEHEGDFAVAAADQQPRGIDHAHLPVPRRDAARDQHHAHLWQILHTRRSAAMRSALTAAGLRPITRSPRASDLPNCVPGQKSVASWSGNDVTRNTGMRSVAASALQAAAALWVCTISMRSLAIRFARRRAFPRMRNGLNVSLRIDSHSPLKARSSPTAVAGNDGAGAGLQQRECDIDRVVAGRIVTQRRHQL